MSSKREVSGNRHFTHVFIHSDLQIPTDGMPLLPRQNRGNDCVPFKGFGKQKTDQDLLWGRQGLLGSTLQRLKYWAHGRMGSIISRSDVMSSVRVERNWEAPPRLCLNSYILNQRKALCIMGREVDNAEEQRGRREEQHDRSLGSANRRNPQEVLVHFDLEGYLQ